MTDPLMALIVALTLLALTAGVFLFVIPRWRRSRQQNERIRMEDALKHILGCEMTGGRFTANSLAGALQITADQAADLLLEMEHRGLLHAEADSMRLTPMGREFALHILGAHRLWERYLADETGVEELEWHGQAEWHEHQLTPEEAQAVFAQLLAEGLYPGMEVRLVESSPHRIRFWAGGDEHTLAPVVASNIVVARPPDNEDSDGNTGLRLSDLAQGERGLVMEISAQCRGLERRRLQDLGFLPGADIQAELTSNGGDPVAYRIRGALIALRKEQANQIRIQRTEGNE